MACAFAAGVFAAAPAAAQSPAPEQARPEAPPANPYQPPPCQGTIFTDVTCSTTFDPWIEQFAADQITSGCGGGAYCPSASVTRAQMAVFVEKAMRGTGFWSPGNLGSGNTGLGQDALVGNATSSQANTAVGDHALATQSYDAGSPLFTSNTAVGWYALYSNQPTSPDNGKDNTAVGESALTSNTTGAFNTALGASSQLLTTTGFENTAVGSVSLSGNTTGSDNTAIGGSSLEFATASNNTGVGAVSLHGDTTGFDNTAIGWKAGARGGDMITGYAGSTVTFVSNSTGSYNTFVGIAGSTTDVDNCTAVGMDAYCDATNQVRLGNVFVNSIGGKVAWSALSDQRSKSDIRNLDLGLPLILALRPVAYRYKSGNGRIDMGFVGQDVEALLGDSYNVLDVGGDAQRTLSLRYSELIAPLVKAVQEQEAEIASRDSRIAELEKQVNGQQARLDLLERHIETLIGRDAAAPPTNPEPPTTRTLSGPAFRGAASSARRR